MSIERPRPCNKCGKSIFWDDDHVAPSGKKIPLEEDEVGEPRPHNCSESTYGRQQPNDAVAALQEVEAVKRTLASLAKRLDEVEKTVSKDVPLNRLIKVEQDIFELRQLIKKKVPMFDKVEETK